MRPYSLHQNDLVRVTHFHIESVLVALKIEHDPVARQETRRCVSFLHVRWGLPLCLLHFNAPRADLFLHVGMLRPERL